MRLYKGRDQTLKQARKEMVFGNNGVQISALRVANYLTGCSQRPPPVLLPPGFHREAHGTDAEVHRDDSKRGPPLRFRP